MTVSIDASFDVTVERTAFGDVTLFLARPDLRIELDPAEAARVCQQIWAALGRNQSEWAATAAPAAAVPEAVDG